jgi:cytochrome c oxidase subunit 2
MPFWGQLSLQEAASPVIFFLIKFHDHAILVLTLVITFVGYIILIIISGSFSCRKTLEANELETIWTILPAVILIFLAIPSLRLLYLIDEAIDPQITLKTIGHQWYWRYEYPDFNHFRFDSYILPSADLTEGQFRLLEVDHRAILPIQIEIRVLVTAADVIHAWAVPRLGVKVDAIPGRTNQLSIYISRPGIYYGQCSEICGANHRFIPIVIEAIHPKSFLEWVKKFSSESDTPTSWTQWIIKHTKSLSHILNI